MPGLRLATTDDVPAIESRKAYGRRQPFAAYQGTGAVQGERREQNPLDAMGNPLVVMGQPKHTFFRQNSQRDDNTVTNSDASLKLPFDWLPHLDRLMVPRSAAAVKGSAPRLAGYRRASLPRRSSASSSGNEMSSSRPFSTVRLPSSGVTIPALSLPYPVASLS